MNEKIGRIYVVYYDKVMPLDSSPASPFYKEAINTIRYDIGPEVMESLGYWFDKDDDRRWAFNTNSDSDGMRYAANYIPGGQYNIQRDKEYRIGAGRPTIVVLRDTRGEKEYIEIRSSSDVYSLRSKFKYKK
jgi:hypothetical protein